MAIPSLIHHGKGLWKGKSKLHLSFLPPDQQVSESDSQLRIETDENGTYATISYNWQHEGTPQEGTMLICSDADTNAVQLAWVDSWHQSSSVMHLTGSVNESGEVQTKGTFQADTETWGWTVGFRLEGENLLLEMDVVPPNEEGEWAVRADYRRT